EILVRIRYPREMLARVCAQQFLIGGRAWFAPLPVTVPTLQKRHGSYNPLRPLRMTGPAVLGAAWVVKNLHAILLARFHARDKLRFLPCRMQSKRRGPHPTSAVIDRCYSCHSKRSRGISDYSVLGKARDVSTLPRMTISF